MNRLPKYTTEFFLKWTGPIGFWLFIFIGIALVVLLALVHDDLVTNQKDNKEFADAYNRSLASHAKLLQTIQDEELTRLSGDNEFTKGSLDWREKIDKKIDQLIEQTGGKSE
jgi:hypothetical protein